MNSPALSVVVLPWNTDSFIWYFLPSTSLIPEPLRWFCEGGGVGRGGVRGKGGEGSVTEEGWGKS